MPGRRPGTEEDDAPARGFPRQPCGDDSQRRIVAKGSGKLHGQVALRKGRAHGGDITGIRPRANAPAEQFRRQYRRIGHQRGRDAGSGQPRQRAAVAHADPVRDAQLAQHLLAQHRVAPVQIDAADAKKHPCAVLRGLTFIQAVGGAVRTAEKIPRPVEAFQPAVELCDHARRLLRRQQHHRRLPGVAAQQFAADVDHRRLWPLAQHLADSAHAVAAERRQVACRQPGDDDRARRQQR